MTAPAYAYKRALHGGPKRQNADPEHRFQVAVATYLTYALPAGYHFTANPAGMRTTMNVAVKNKAAGVRRGWPDMQILFPTGVTRYIELKIDADLSKDQKDFRTACTVTGRDIWSLARTIEEVEAALLRWKVPVRCPVNHANRYHINLEPE